MAEKKKVIGPMGEGGGGASGGLAAYTDDWCISRNLYIVHVSKRSHVVHNKEKVSSKYKKNLLTLITAEGGERRLDVLFTG